MVKVNDRGPFHDDRLIDLLCCSFEVGFCGTGGNHRGRGGYKGRSPRERR